jgi:hypothetical protein
LGPLVAKLGKDQKRKDKKISTKCFVGGKEQIK